MAEAEADAAQIRAQGDTYAQDIRERAQLRADSRALRQQANVEAIVRGALPQLPAAVSEEPADPDWISEFFKQCEDIGDTEMQTVWSKLLAGEIAQPGRFSRRTLQMVRLLSKGEAHLFTRFASYVWTGDGEAIYFRLPDIESYLAQRGISFGALMHLRTIGLLEFESNLVRIIHADQRVPFACSGRYFRVWSENADRQIPIAALTSVARELLPVSGALEDQRFPAVASAALAANGMMLLDGLAGTIAVTETPPPPPQPDKP